MASKTKQTAEEGETDPGTMSAASQTTRPEAPPQGDGKAPYREDFEAVYKRLADIEARLDLIEKKLGDGLSDSARGDRSDIASRVANIERRLEGNIA